MRDEIFSNISKIIERDSKVSTYKYALLRGTIDVIQDNSPYIDFEDQMVIIPVGLLVEKWLLYYYPIFESPTFIPQIGRTRNLAFEKQFQALVKHYSLRGGFSAFYNDFRNKGVPFEVSDLLKDLVSKIAETIINQPMKYIGRSLTNDYHSIYKIVGKKKRISVPIITLDSIIQRYEKFSIPIEYFRAFQLLGSFISGQDSILFKWAEFSVNTSNKDLNLEFVINHILKNPITERETSYSKLLYRNILEKEGSVYCVWTGDKINRYDVDHLIPFSIWKNNDLWNLLPSKPQINNEKKDKIPSPILIENRKEMIVQYWELIFKGLPERFKKEIKVSLLGNSGFDNWQITTIKRLVETCNHLITIRGFEEWNPKN